DIFSNFDRLKAGIIFTDNDKNILWANKKFLNLFNTDLQSLKNQKCWNLLHPESQNCHLCETEDNIHLQVAINGTKYHLLISNTPIGSIELSIIHEITKIMSEFEKLSKEVNELKEMIKNTFGSYKFLIACSDCQKIRLEDGTWVKPADIKSIMETTGISHGLCPECAKPYIEDLIKKKD
ncbi:MAG: PAS domain-containing protein, partial [Candidatus Schekmanbacteria bacterium]